MGGLPKGVWFPVQVCCINKVRVCSLALSLFSLSLLEVSKSDKNVTTVGCKKEHYNEVFSTIRKIADGDNNTL